jgi:CDP-diacylglycerol--glycerol-3-phosphate 3-phosphatidyltransferase
MKRMVPWAMVWGRALLGPLIVLAAWKGVVGWALSLTVLVGLLDDIADGMVARRWNCDTPALRLADSSADTVFYLGTAFAVWVRSPELFRANWVWLAILVGLEGLRYVFDFWKFGKGASYHSYLAKAWGLVLAGAIMRVLWSGGPLWVVTVAAVLGMIVNLEGLAMSIILQHWQNDVKTLQAAWRIRVDSTLAAEEER